MSSGPRPPRRPADLLTAAMVRRLRLEPARNRITVDRGIRVPMRDGTVLVADHYAPVTPQRRPTVLLRCPYGRGPQFAILAWPIARHGYHVLLQSTRGTFGSGGQFMPGVDEAADGQDTVSWLRTQDWFNGRLAAVGPSYLAFAAWALATDPPPELTALAVYISTHDLAAAGFGQGPFELYNLLMWSDLMATQERFGAVRMAWRTINADKRLAQAADRLPIAASGAGLEAGAPWYAEWLARPDRTDPYYSGYSAAAALDRITVPTLLISGFHDFFVDQTLHQYQALRQRGVRTDLVIGPWTHMTLDLSVAIRETLDWLDAFADGDAADPPAQPYPVRVWTSGAGHWHALPDWPLASTTAQAWHLQPGGELAASRLPAGTASPAGTIANGVAPAAALALESDSLQDLDASLDGAAPGQHVRSATRFTYDPADPTPSVGGRLMSMRNGGSADNTALEARSDVVTFTTAPLEQPLHVIGVPSLELYLSSDNPHGDIFARLCDVDELGCSRNLTDQITRPLPAEWTPGDARRVAITLTAVSHVFLPGHRIRLQISGGAHPRFARNLGTDEDLLFGTRMAPVTHEIQHGEQHPSALILPALPGPAAAQPAAADSAAAQPEQAQAQ
jgi:uncharacterized protein